MKNVLLTCPIRGELTATSLAADGLTPTEEAMRIDLLEFLINKRGYPKERIDVETVVLTNIGNAGRNSLRADVIVYDIDKSEARTLSAEKRLTHAHLIAEVKRDGKQKKSAITHQLEPALKLAPSMNTLGIYWDDEDRILYRKILEDNSLSVISSTVAKLPKWGLSLTGNPITYEQLSSPKDLFKTLNGLADIMRSCGVEDKRLRYVETVKLLLARYTDEKSASDPQDPNEGIMELQIMPDGDPNFRNRVDRVYERSAARYSKAKTLFAKKTSQLSDSTLRQLVNKIQGFRLTDAKTESIQQIFMSFVPTVFKKELSQYFTPISLIETVVEIVGVGALDKVVDPAMGTGDFLASALAYQRDDDDIHQRIFGIDRDESAYELAIVNMILNNDGQTGLKHGDSIERHGLWEGEMNVAFCNPPFGSRTLEKKKSVLKEYELAHKWVESPGERLVKTEEVLDKQQLGILFVERCWKMLVDGGRLGIILPEGYLSGAKYRYLRQWILDHFVIHALVELPRRMFVKSDADLRSNILVLEKKEGGSVDPGHKVYASMVRKVGYNLGGNFSATPQQDPETGLVLHDDENEPLLDSDFNRVLDEYASFKEMTDRQWEGAHVKDILNHPELDMKPRRLVPRAVQLMHSLNSDSRVVRLGDIAEMVRENIRVGNPKNKSALFRAIEGQNIRAVEGIVSPGDPERGWHIAQRKASACYPIKQYDIVVGLVRPERRNVGLVLEGEGGLVGIKDGVGVVRSIDDKYPPGWLFYALRREETRIQMWINAGGTSYGKLSLEQIEDLLLRVDDDVDEINDAVLAWVQAHDLALNAWQKIGTADDRRPILNSPLIGLIEGADAIGGEDSYLFSTTLRADKGTPKATSARNLLKKEETLTSISTAGG